MNAIEIRPSFQVDLPWEPAEASRRLQAVFRTSPFADRGDALGSVAEISVPAGQERLWSPHLSLVIDRAAEDHTGGQTTPGEGSLLRGRFAPRPSVWTAVMMIYFSGGFLAFCGLVWGYAQWMMKSTPWALASIPLGLSFFAAVYLVSKIGQSLSSDQMSELRELFDDALEQMHAQV